MTPRETWHFDTPRIGRQVLVFDELDSTNSVAARLAAAGVDEGTVVLARHQTAGRGRFGRVWQSRPGAALLMSVVLYPPADVRRPVVLTAWAAVAVADAVSRLTGHHARIKWPNDLLVRDKKVCGILIEQGVGGPRPAGTRTIVGIGLNLNQTAEEFQAAELPDATSLDQLTGGTINTRAALEEVVRRLDGEYQRLLDGGRHMMEDEWRRRTGLLGRHVAVERTDGELLCRPAEGDGLRRPGGGRGRPPAGAAAAGNRGPHPGGVTGRILL